MGCAVSVYAVGKKKKKSIIPEVSIFVPSMRVPAQCDLQRTLKGVLPKDLADRLSSIRNQILLIAQDTGIYTHALKMETCSHITLIPYLIDLLITSLCSLDVSAIDELQQTLSEYLSLLVGLTRKG